MLTADKLFVAHCEYQYSVVNMLSVYEYLGIHSLAGEVCQLFPSSRGQLCPVLLMDNLAYKLLAIKSPHPDAFPMLVVRII